MELTTLVDRIAPTREQAAALLGVSKDRLRRILAGDGPKTCPGPMLELLQDHLKRVGVDVRYEELVFAWVESFR